MLWGQNHQSLYNWWICGLEGREGAKSDSKMSRPRVGETCWVQDAGRTVSAFPGHERICCRGPSSLAPSGKTLTLTFLSQEKDVTPDKNLLSKVQDAALWLETLSDGRPPKPSLATASSVADFFLALTICNSVMVSTTTEPRQRVRTGDGVGGMDGRITGMKGVPCTIAQNTWVLVTLSPCHHCETLNKALVLSGPQSPYVLNTI